MSEYDLDAQKVKEALNARALEMAMYLLPNGKQHGNCWQVGSVGGEAGKSLQLSTSGAGAGLWNDFATDQGGDLLTLWMAVYGLTFREALREAADYLGIEPNSYARQLSPEAITLLKTSLEQGLNLDEKEKLKQLTRGFKHG